MSDSRRGVLRSAVVVDGQLQAALFMSRNGGLPPRDWLAAQLDGADVAIAELLAGRPATPAPDRGAIVCVCFDIGMTTIIDAIAAQTLVTVEAVGKAINAGTNCGSCRPAIAQMLALTKENAHG
jgi:assimilatory nitrate reductase catalytic subunit